MTEYKTMRVPQEAWEAAKASKKAEETWGEFIQRCSNNPPEVKRFVEESTTNTVQLEATEYRKIADELIQRMR